MDNAVKRFKQRRDVRMKKRLDDDWITIKGTHVMVDDDKQITKGPEKLRALSSKKGGESGGGNEYEKIPYAFSVGGSKYATPEEKRKRKETIDRFMANAKEGDVYAVGGGFGSGGAKFEVTRRRGKMALRWLGEGYSQPVIMSRANVESYIRNGAKKIN